MWSPSSLFIGTLMLSLSALGCHAQTEVCHGSGSRSSRSNRFLTTGIERPRTGVQAEAEAVAESGCGVELPSALAAGNLLAHGDVQLRLAAELRLAAAAQLRLAAELIGVGCGAGQSESTRVLQRHPSARTGVLQRHPSAGTSVLHPRRRRHSCNPVEAQCPFHVLKWLRWQMYGQLAWYPSGSPGRGYPTPTR